MNSNLNISVDNKSVLPNDFASNIRRVIPIRDIIGIRYLNYSPQHTLLFLLIESPISYL